MLRNKLSPESGFILLKHWCASAVPYGTADFLFLLTYKSYNWAHLSVVWLYTSWLRLAASWSLQAVTLQVASPCGPGFLTSWWLADWGMRFRKGVLLTLRALCHLGKEVTWCYPPPHTHTLSGLEKL